MTGAKESTGVVQSGAAVGAAAPDRAGAPALDAGVPLMGGGAPTVGAGRPAVGDGRAATCAGDAASDAGAASGRPAETLASLPAVRAAFDLAHGPVLLLDGQRRVLLARAGAGDLLCDEDPAALAGASAGAALGCQYAVDPDATAVPGRVACGANPACEGCELSRLLEARVPASAACVVPVPRDGRDGLLHFRARTSPLDHEGETLMLLALHDARALHRRDELDRAFLHDVSDALGALLLWARLLEARPADAARAVRHLGALAGGLALSVEDKRVQLQAETGRLQVERASVTAEGVLDAVRAAVEVAPVASGRVVETGLVGPGFELVTDAALLVRVLAALCRAALEALPQGGAVRLSAEGLADGCEWRVEIGPCEGAAPRADSEAGRRSRRGLDFSRLLIEQYLEGSVAAPDDAAPGGRAFVVRLRR